MRRLAGRKHNLETYFPSARCLRLPALELGIRVIRIGAAVLI